MEGKLFCRLICKTVVTVFIEMSSACFIWARKCDINDLFLPSRSRALRDEDRLFAYEKILIFSSHEMEARSIKRSLLMITIKCAVDPMATPLAFTRANGMIWTASEAVKWFVYNSASTKIISVPKWKANGCNWGHDVDALLRSVHSKSVPGNVKEFWKIALKCYFAEPAWYRSKMEGADLRGTRPIEKQRALV